MSNTKIRHRAREGMIELLDSSSNGQLCFEIRIAIMQVEILDEYLQEKIRSDKVIEGVLRDIRASIDEVAKGNQQFKLEDVTMEPIKDIVKANGVRVPLTDLEGPSRAWAIRCVEAGWLAGVTDDGGIINVELYHPGPGQRDQDQGKDQAQGKDQDQAADQGKDQGTDQAQAADQAQAGKSESGPDKEKNRDPDQGL